MMRFGVYLVGLALVVVAVWVLLVSLNVTAIVPATLIAVVLLLLLGLGVMHGAREVDETPHEIVETRQRTGGTEVRRSKLE